MDPRHLRYKILPITLKTPGQIRDILVAEGTLGWRVGGVGPSYLFFARQGEEPVENRMESIAMKSPAGILERVQAECRDGWQMGALGSHYLFLGRRPGQEARPREFSIHPIALKTPTGIMLQADVLGQEGWRLCGIGSSLAVYEREPGSPAAASHRFENVMFHTAGGLQYLLEERAREGWELADVSRVYMVFRRTDLGGISGEPPEDRSTTAAGS